MSEFKLTEEQIRFFDVFGFLAFPGMLHDCISEIQDEFEAIWDHNGGGHFGQQHDEERRSALAQFVDRSERLCALLDDPRILGIAKSLLGDDFNYMGSDGNYYVGDTIWHSDGWKVKIKHIKIAFYLDPLTADTGCLRVIPGSHIPRDQYAGFLADHVERRKHEETMGLQGKEIPAVSLETMPGDVVCFNHNLKHAAFGGGKRRRMFTMNCCERYPEDDTEELVDIINKGARFWVEQAYGPLMVQTAGPERMRHLEQKMAHDDQLAELARTARKEMAEPARG